MKEREAVGNVLMDTTGGEGSLSQNRFQILEVCCLITKVSRNIACGRINLTLVKCFICFLLSVTVDIGPF